MNIDWSKAPPHATHWCPGNAKIEAGWIYNPGGTGGEFYSCYADKGLEHIPAFPEWRKLRLVPRPSKTSWAGEGLPPVGTVCELRAHKLTDWSMAKIEFAFRNVIVWDWMGEPCMNGLCTAYSHDVEMRPIRTPEQIAAEEREAKAKAMYLSVYFAVSEESWDHIPEATRETFRKAIDAGWQQVTP